MERGWAFLVYNTPDELRARQRTLVSRPASSTISRSGRMFRGLRRRVARRGRSGGPPSLARRLLRDGRPAEGPPEGTWTYGSCPRN
ncbi:MAG: hypothetical protein MZU79_07200 [Anaerotruncus sp.]|nr:hypothetical protein [Anaerotruncus sp.]